MRDKVSHIFGIGPMWYTSLNYTPSHVTDQFPQMAFHKYVREEGFGDMVELQ